MFTHFLQVFHSAFWTFLNFFLDFTASKDIAIYANLLPSLSAIAECFARLSYRLGVCPSLRSSVRPSHPGTVSKRPYLES